MNNPSSPKQKNRSSTWANDGIQRSKRARDDVRLLAHILTFQTGHSRNLLEFFLHVYCDEEEVGSGACCCSGVLNNWVGIGWYST